MSQPQPTPPASDAYGQAISEERQADLQAILDAWNAPGADHGERRGPFDGKALSGADVSWLAEQSGRDADGRVPNLHLEGADLGNAHLKGAILHNAHLEGAGLYRAHLEGADLGNAYLERANLRNAYLEGAGLYRAHLERADLSYAYLEAATFRWAHLEGAIFRETWLDSKTVLSDAMLDDKTLLADIQWSAVGAVNLTRLNWGGVPRLGDETSLKPGDDATSYEAGVRAYRQLAAQLRAQGMSEVADRFSERAQIVQRRVLRKRRRLLQYLGAWLLALLAGYGYRPARTILWYLIFVLGFAALYVRFGFVDGHPFRPLEALVFSLTSFHGRGFFPGGLHLDDPVTVLAAAEAVLGLLLEISFIATFTQRFFGSK